jgi:uncharacterized membrane protein/uncharacterized membrane protein YeaQ/YmgE (transglycosylase-associated protein family)
MMAAGEARTMQLVVWTLTGLGAGLVVRLAMRSRRDYGLVGDLLTGWLGGVIGGWLFRQIGMTAPDVPAGHVVMALVGASALLMGMRVLRTAHTAVGAPLESAPILGDLETRLRELGQLERRILSHLLEHRPTTRDPNQTFDRQATFGERIADRVALFGGSWTFIGLFMIGMISWMTLNQESAKPFDPYPFILLNLILSCLAALQAPIIMMSQNRQAAKDRSDARNDYEVNVRAEMQITTLHAKLDALREEEIHRLMQLVEAQEQRVEALQQQLAEAGGHSLPGA